MEQGFAVNAGTGGETRVHPLRYDGRIAKLYKIFIVNLLLSSVTLGMYRFWGKTRMRQYLAASVALNGERFEYTGTGGELFRGFLKALPILLLLFVVPSLLFGAESPLQLLVLLAIFYFIHVGSYAALRYRLSRTTWRGIRGRLTGSAFRYGWLGMLRFVLGLLTLGLLAPRLDVMLWRYKVEHIFFGTAPLAFDGDHRELYEINIISILLSLFTLGVSRLWYQAALLNFQFKHMTFLNCRFQPDFTAVKYLKLIGGNLLILVLTLGFGLPVLIHRNARFFTENLALASAGELNVEQIRQSQEELRRSGEGLALAFDLDFV